MKLKIIIGSTRPGRKGPAVAQWAFDAAADTGFDAELVDLAEVNLPILDEPNHPSRKDYQHDHTKRWSAIVDDADAFVIVTPEYDFFPPAGLINAIQALSKEWKYKPAGVVCYGGVSGGLRSAQELRLLLSNMNVMPLPQIVPIPFFGQHINDDGVLEPNEPMAKGIAGMYSELERWATALQPMRD